MTLQSSGQISLGNVRSEFGDSGEVAISNYYGVSGLPASGQISLSDFYGVSDVIAPTSVTVSSDSTINNINSDTGPSSGTATATVSVSNGKIVPTPADVGDYNYEFTRISSAHNNFVSRSSPFTNTTGGISRTTKSLSPEPLSSLSASETWRVRVYNAAGTTTSGNFSLSASVQNDYDPECFSFDTPVLMSNGDYKLAGDLVVGDTVRSFTTPTMIDENIDGWEEWTASDVSDGTIETSEVIRAMHHEVPDYYLLNDEIKVSATHPFLVFRNDIWQWVRTSSLELGDQFYAEDGTYIPLTTVQHITSPITVVNIGVEEVDTYFGGKINGKAILAHNK